MKEETKKQMIEVLDQAFKTFYEGVKNYIYDLESSHFIHHPEDDETEVYRMTHRPDPEEGKLIHDDHEYWVKVEDLLNDEVITFTINLDWARVTKKTEDGEQVIVDRLYDIPAEFKFYKIDEELDLWSIPIAQFFNNEGYFYPSETARLLEKYNSMEEYKLNKLDFKRYLEKSKADKQKIFWTANRQLNFIKWSVEKAGILNQGVSFKHLELAFLQNLVQEEQKLAELIPGF